jgi:hypothetical protein
MSVAIGRCALPLPARLERPALAGQRCPAGRQARSPRSIRRRRAPSRALARDI